MQTQAKVLSELCIHGLYLRIQAYGHNSKKIIKKYQLFAAVSDMNKRMNFGIFRNFELKKLGSKDNTLQQDSPEIYTLRHTLKAEQRCVKIQPVRPLTFRNETQPTHEEAIIKREK